MIVSRKVVSLIVCSSLNCIISFNLDDEVGDGTTSVVVLAGALLDEAENLLEKVCVCQRFGVILHFLAQQHCL